MSTEEYDRMSISSSDSDSDSDIEIELDLDIEIDVPQPKYSGSESEKSINSLEIDFSELKINNNNDKKKNTVVCNNIIKNGSCERKVCNFAHTLSELNPVLCKYDTNCRIQKCIFIHSNQTKEEYIKKLNLSEEVMKVLTTKKQMIKKYVKPYIIKTNLENVEENVKIALSTGKKIFTIVIQD